MLIITKINSDFPIPTEGGVEATTGIQAHQGKIEKSTTSLVSTHHQNLPTRLNDCIIGIRPSTRDNTEYFFTIALASREKLTKGVVQAAIWVVARDGKSRHSICKIDFLAYYYHLAIWLSSETVSKVFSTKIGDLSSIPTEGSIKASTRVQASNGEIVAIRAAATIAGNHNLPIGALDV